MTHVDDALDSLSPKRKKNVKVEETYNAATYSQQGPDPS